MGKGFSSEKPLEHESSDAHRFASKQPIIIIDFSHFQEFASDMRVLMIQILEHPGNQPLFID